MTTVAIIADSICPAGIRLTTFELRYPRYIHAELMTHRVFSRNARSSRAVPTSKLIDEVQDNPVVPIHWGKNCKGMQAAEELSHTTAMAAEYSWKKARDYAVAEARYLLHLGVHKQVVNRLLEPFSWIDVLVTSTDWNNWWSLRDHKDAQPEMRSLARLMRDAYNDGSPQSLDPGEWHLPYINDEDLMFFFTGPIDLKVLGPAKVSAARCRRISYKPFDGSEASIEADLARFDEMVTARPIHASPLEHQAMATGDPNVRSGNFRGYVQFRQMIKGHVAEG